MDDLARTSSKETLGATVASCLNEQHSSSVIGARASYPNFDFIRLVAASSVIFSHAFLIADGDQTREPLIRVLGPGNAIGIYGVHCFFIISGFLVTQSLLQSKSVLEYLWRRFLRIYPGLFVCLFISAFVMGALLSHKSPLHFLASPEPFKYLLKNLWHPGRSGDMPSVVFYPGSGWLGASINGSLWSIFHEVACYILLVLLYVVGVLRSWVTALLAVGMIVAASIGFTSNSETTRDFLFVAPSFLAGATYSILEPKRTSTFTIVVAVSSLVVLALAVWYELFGNLFPLAGAPLILLLGTSRFVRLPQLKRIGDISYGTYLYGWPVEQLVRAAVGPAASWTTVFLASLPISFALGCASWWMIEQPALKFKTLHPQSRAARLGN